MKLALITEAFANCVETVDSVIPIKTSEETDRGILYTVDALISSNMRQSYRGSVSWAWNMSGIPAKAKELRRYREGGRE